MNGISLDPESNVITEQFAVVKAGRRVRGRVPETVVEIVESQEIAMEKSQADTQLLAAKVIGPSRSSEGLRLYYIVEWFDKPA